MTKNVFKNLSFRKIEYQVALNAEQSVFLKNVCSRYFRVGSIRENDKEFGAETEYSSPVGLKFKSIASQCCGVLASDTLKFTTSTFIGFHIILISELHKESSEIVVTLDQLTWIGKYNFKNYFIKYHFVIYGPL